MFMREQEGYDRASAWEDRRAFCSILKAQKHRFEMPVTDLCDRAYVDSRKGLSTSSFLRAPSSRHANVWSRRHDAFPYRGCADARRGCSLSRLYYLTRVNAPAKRARISRLRLLAPSVEKGVEHRESPSARQPNHPEEISNRWI